jgi:hypothetical protein
VAGCCPRDGVSHARTLEAARCRRRVGYHAGRLRPEKAEPPTRRRSRWTWSSRWPPWTAAPSTARSFPADWCWRRSRSGSSSTGRGGRGISTTPDDRPAAPSHKWELNRCGTWDACGCCGSCVVQHRAERLRRGLTVVTANASEFGRVAGAPLGSSTALRSGLAPSGSAVPQSWFRSLFQAGT